MEKRTLYAGQFLCEKDGFKPFADLDGKEARRFLELNGYEVVTNYDKKTNGIAITKCGLHLSTNGWLYTKIEI